jgi:exopolysaccharide biosynthesis polyprenyl glycosylphosphotransferase
MTVTTLEATRTHQEPLKRTLDLLTAGVGLVVTAPVFLGIAALIRLDSPGPVFFRQERPGRDMRPFTMLKFRSMRVGSDAIKPEDFEALGYGPLQKQQADPRVTRIGKFLRRTSLDELPQLINVLRGEMSLVGPRPERPGYVEYFREHVRRYDGRLRTKAGITGWAQIHRLRGQTSIADRVEWDNYYIENFSLWLDFKILLRTIPEALKGRAD